MPIQRLPTRRCGGGSGVVLEQSAGEELMAAVDEALQGLVYLSREVAR